EIAEFLFCFLHSEPDFLRFELLLNSIEAHRLESDRKRRCASSRKCQHGIEVRAELVKFVGILSVGSLAGRQILEMEDGAMDTLVDLFACDLDRSRKSAQIGCSYEEVELVGECSRIRRALLERIHRPERFENFSVHPLAVQERGGTTGGIRRICVQIGRAVVQKLVQLS